ncbi:MAG TPA: hypothetical protein VFT04_11325 [Gemmatimonadales bacterium]|nr:hypothetical protein [Gemmatimonadales bacterium]
MKTKYRLALALGLALLPSTMLAPAAAAQGRSPADTRIVESHRLTMPMLRKVLPALYAPGAESCPRDRRDPRTLSLAEMAQMIERCAPMAQALRRAGVPSREAALVMASVYRTAEAVAIRRGEVSAVDAGPLRDNALLMQQNDAEIKRLTGED